MQIFSVGNYIFHIVNSCGAEINCENIAGFTPHSRVTNKVCITINIHIDSNPISGKELFVADNSSEFFSQNIWRVIKYRDKIHYSVDYLNHPTLKQVNFTYSEDRTAIDLIFTPSNLQKSLNLNPFEHPVGILMISRLQQMFGGFIIHGSGVCDNGNGYIFTGVSGIGKSTMAGIWGSIGAEIVNDDRLMICKDANGYSFYNTPMPHYNDVSKNAPLKAIFLLSQSPTNHCTKISGIKALSKVMANFIQQFYNTEVIAKQLDQTEELVNSIPVYELGFKPDTDIITLIRDLKL